MLRNIFDLIFLKFKYNSRREEKKKTFGRLGTEGLFHIKFEEIVNLFKARKI